MCKLVRLNIYNQDMTMCIHRIVESNLSDINFSFANFFISIKDFVLPTFKWFLASPKLISSRASKMLVVSLVLLDPTLIELIDIIGFANICCGYKNQT